MVCGYFESFGVLSQTTQKDCVVSGGRAQALRTPVDTQEVRTEITENILYTQKITEVSWSSYLRLIKPLYCLCGLCDLLCSDRF